MPPPAVAWAPAKLAASPPATSAVSQELFALAKQLELVEHQRQQLLLKTASPPVSPARATQRRTPSPAAAMLAPLPPSPSRSTSLGLAPALAVSDVVVCDVCAAELASAPLLRTHKTASCPLRIVTCPRAGCGMSFVAQDRAAHDRDDCAAARRTQQLLDDHVRAHTLVPCSACGAFVEVRGMDDHKRFLCGKREVACQFEAFGCHDRFAFDQREVHEATVCRVARHRAQVRADAATVNEEVACEWCGQQVLKRRMLDHQEDACSKRERPCPNEPNGCPEWVPVDAVDEHLKTTCIVTRTRNAMAAHAAEMDAPIICHECGASIKRRHLIGHVARECVSRIVPCKNAAHGCHARLRWRDRHLHEDFMALASHERSMLHFPVGGRAYVALQSETLDFPPPWTLELFLWMIGADEEILNLHAKALELVETVILKQREHERFEGQSKACTKKLKALKHVHKADKDARSNSQILGDVSRQAKELADEFAAADTGVVETAQAIALAKGEIQILITDAHRLLQDERQRDADAATAIQRDVETQALDRMTSRELLSGDFLSEDEQLRLGDLDRWMTDIASSRDSTVATAERKSRAAEQQKLLDKRATLKQSIDELGNVDAAEAARLRRRYDRELAKVEAKLALVSDHTPTALLDRRGRHVIASSARTAMVLAGASTNRITFVRTVAGANAKLAPRGSVDLGVTLTRNQWHHVAFCASPRELSLIVDGDAKAVKRGLFELPFTRLGSNDHAAAESFQGFLQEVRVWKTCLSKDYLVANAAQIVDVPRQIDLVAYYTFEEGGDDVVDDMALVQPRAACFGTEWVLYNTPAIRRRFGLPPTPSLRDKTSCVINQRLKLLAQRARDRETEPQACRLGCGIQMPLKNLEIHQRVECVYRLVVCHEVGCEQVFRSGDRERHLATNCERRAFRDALVKQYEDRETSEPCLLRCGASVKRRHAERHYMRECPNRLFTCPQDDCGESIVAKGLTQHLRDECKSAELVAERKMVVRARHRQHEKQQKNK